MISGLLGQRTDPGEGGDDRETAETSWYAHASRGLQGAVSLWSHGGRLRVGQRNGNTPSGMLCFVLYSSFFYLVSVIMLSVMSNTVPLLLIYC